MAWQGRLNLAIALRGALAIIAADLPGRARMKKLLTVNDPQGRVMLDLTIANGGLNREYPM